MTFEELVNGLMADEYNPNKVNNFLEAMEQTNKEQGERLQELLENRDFETLGRWVWNHTVEVMEGYATDRANYEMDIRTVVSSKPKPDSWVSITPLYTAPRELSDEEIINIWGEVTFSDSLLEFARATLKKASE